MCHFGNLRGDMMRSMAPHRQHPGPGNFHFEIQLARYPARLWMGDPAELLNSPLIPLNDGESRLHELHFTPRIIWSRTRQNQRASNPSQACCSGEEKAVCAIA